MKIPDSSNMGSVDLRSSGLAFFHRSVQGKAKFISESSLVGSAESWMSVAFSSNYIMWSEH